MYAPSHPRAPQENEWAALRAAVNNVFRPAGGDLTAETPLLFDPTNRDHLRVIVDSAPSTEATADASGDPRLSRFPRFPRILAHAGSVARDAMVLRRRIRVTCIGAVFTVPDARGQGLASRLLADVLARARPTADLVMASGDGGLYRRQGLDAVPPLARFRLPERSDGGAVSTLEIRDATAADLRAMGALYDAEDVHFVRSDADWERLWAAGRLVDTRARFSIVTRGGQVVAYLCAQEGERRGDGSERPRRIMEFAGDRDTILDAAPALGEELLVPSYDTSTIALCERRGWSQSNRQFPITGLALTPDVLVIPWYGLNYL